MSEQVYGHSVVLITWVLLHCRNHWIPQWRPGITCSAAEVCPQSGDRQLKERVKIVTLIKGSWVPPRLHGLPHPSGTHPLSSLSSTLPHLPVSQWIYYPPLSARVHKWPRFLNFMPWVNLFFPSNGGCWASLKWLASFFSYFIPGRGMKVQRMYVEYWHQGHKWGRKTNQLCNELQVKAATFE